MTLETTWIPTTPPKKHAIITHDASLAESPPLSNEFFDDGSMLYTAENSMTPKLRLRDTERNVSLFLMSQFLFPGNSRTIRSTQMNEAPNMQAIPLNPVMTHPRSSFVRPMLWLYGRYWCIEVVESVQVVVAQF